MQAGKKQKDEEPTSVMLSLETGEQFLNRMFGSK